MPERLTAASFPRLLTISAPSHYTEDHLSLVSSPKLPIPTTPNELRRLPFLTDEYHRIAMALQVINDISDGLVAFYNKCSDSQSFDDFIDMLESSGIMAENLADWQVANAFVRGFQNFILELKKVASILESKLAGSKIIRGVYSLTLLADHKSIGNQTLSFISNQVVSNVSKMRSDLTDAELKIVRKGALSARDLYLQILDLGLTGKH